MSEDSVAVEVPNMMGLYKKKVEDAIALNLSVLGPKSKLRDACEYALTCGGKRFRPILVFMIADALGFGADTTFAALSVEFFHTASLVADDLPSMDNDDERRNKPSVHKKFGEAAALLVSYSLIAAGFELIAKNVKVIKKSGLTVSNLSDQLCVLALENASFNTGINGATSGQFVDLAPSDLSVATLREIIHKKTSSLFEISFVFGWLFGGGDLEKLDLVKQAASHFGMAFQIADDLGDMAQDIKNKRLVNMANVVGRDAALQMFHEEHDRFLLRVKELKVDSSGLEELATLLKDKVEGAG
ncbi:MAG: Farnesyl diphosphate synthase [Chlamydiae bacterium]|nr:Farnesyl diphosphate synthase [Chlamydiota bacterium]